MKPLIQIGVLVHRDRKHTLKTWQKTADYLASEIQYYHFVIVPLDFTQIGVALEQNTVDFIISSPGIYVEFEALYGVNSLATLKRLCMGKAYTVFGGLIFCKTDLSSILTLSDLRGKRFVQLRNILLGVGEQRGEKLSKQVLIHTEISRA